MVRQRKEKTKLKQGSGYLRNRILVMTLTFSIVMSGIITVILSYVYTNYLRNSLLQTTNLNIQFLSDSIDGNMENMIRLIRWSQNNSTISEYVESKEEKSLLSIRAFERLSEELTNNSAKDYVHRVIISNSGTKRFIQIVPSTYSSVTDIAAEAPKLSYFDELYNDSGMNYSVGFVDDPFYKGRTKMVLPLIRPIQNQYSSLQDGWIFIAVTEELFTDSMRYYSKAEDSQVYLSLGEHIYLMSYEGLTELTPSYTIRESKDTKLSENTYTFYCTDNDTGEVSFVLTKKLSMADCYISQTISPSELNSQRSLFFIFVAIAVLLICILGIILFYLLYRTISMPVKKLQVKLALVSAGDFTRDTSIEWQHELGDIGRGINDLSESVLELMERRVEDEKQKKDLEYQMLQSQINPHFLYNTLNSIKWMATVQGADGIAEMTTALSRLLRSITKGTSLVIPLREELNLLRDYFTIQQYRYGGTITMEINVEAEELYDCSIIKFTLQPLVENAIFHGIEPKDAVGHITITVEREEQEVLITVEDDGVGMPPELPERLLTGTGEAKSEFFKEIGIRNVNQRIKYQFGERYGISIETELGAYTRMLIRIPFQI